MIKVLRYILPEFQIIHFIVLLFSGSLKKMPIKQEFEQADKDIDTKNTAIGKQKSKPNKGRVLDV